MLQHIIDRLYQKQALLVLDNIDGVDELESDALAEASPIALPPPSLRNARAYMMSAAVLTDDGVPWYERTEPARAADASEGLPVGYAGAATSIAAGTQIATADWLRYVVALLLGSTQYLHVLATRRHAFDGIQGIGEVVHHLRPLDTDDAAQLFGSLLGRARVAGGKWTVERARAVVNAQNGVPARIVAAAQEMQSTQAEHDVHDAEVEEDDEGVEEDLAAGEEAGTSPINAAAPASVTPAASLSVPPSDTEVD
jgi:hypothetical protein